MINTRGFSSISKGYGSHIKNNARNGRLNSLQNCRKHMQRRWHADKSDSAAGNSIISNGTDVAKALSVGSLAGFCGALTGTGGGFVMIPLMTSSFMRVSQHSAHGTSLFAVAATGVAGALGYGISDIVEIDSAALLATCGMVTARYGAIATSKLSSCNLKRYLGILMIVMSPMVHLKYHLEEQAKQEPSKKKEDITKVDETSLEKYIPVAMIGLTSGFLSGLFGIGGGMINLPALVLGTDMSYHTALGTSLCAMSFPAIVGTYTHIQKGNIAMRVAPPLAMGCFFGAYMGGKFGLQIPDEYLRTGFSGVMITLGAKSFLRM